MGLNWGVYWVKRKNEGKVAGKVIEALVGALVRIGRVVGRRKRRNHAFAL